MIGDKDLDEVSRIKVLSERLEKAAAIPQPMPVKNDRPAIADLVIADINARREFGIKKYGTPLQAFNGRDAAMDAYQESVDQTKYLKQAYEEALEQTIQLRSFIEEREARRAAFGLTPRNPAV